MNRGFHLLLIGLGGMIGTAARASLELAFPAPDGGWPWTTFWINLAGSALLGALLEWLALGDDQGWRRSMRLGVGTGLIGGFTTYSTFSLETASLFQAGHGGLALGYALSSVILGVAAAAGGILLMRRIHPPEVTQ